MAGLPSSRPPGRARGGMRGAISGVVMAASPAGGAGTARRPAGGRAACSSDVWFRGNFPIWVSEGGLECDQGVNTLD